MPDRFRNKYRIASTRLKDWDYGWDVPAYRQAGFVTICTKNRQHFFGEIKNGKMILSSTGVIADILWYEIPHHNPFVTLGDFVVMPNHVHGILVVDKMDNVLGNDVSVETPESGVSTDTSGNQTNPNHNNHGGKNKNWKPGTLGVIINQYKRICTIQARKINPDFAWQPRFHDHVIRNEKSYQNISQYIQTNPGHWPDDGLSGKNSEK